MSSTKLKNLSRQFTGCTITDYIGAKKADHAAHLLADTEIPVELIAKQVGFDTATGFSTSFRKQTGISPTEYREEMLRDYVEKHSFRNPLFLYDDGVSGKTNRPGFQKVLAMIREGQAATLIVTDLTRLYRNQSEANNLLEIVFPVFGCAFYRHYQRL